jgi:predicted nucleotidyltransferase
MNQKHGLSARTVEQIALVLAHFPAVEEAVLFGSRAKGTHKPGSDIDLSLVGAALDWRVVGRIYDALDDLLLPYRFSLILFDGNTDPDVAAHIARVGVPLFRRDQVGGELVHR